VPGRTIREAIAIALEALPGSAAEWVALDRKSLRAHVFEWVHAYAKQRGVVLEDSDIESELREVINEIRRKT
jgi:hypothetical protein